MSKMIERMFVATVASLACVACATTTTNPGAQAMVAACRQAVGEINLCSPAKELPFNPTRLVDANFCVAAEAMARQFVHDAAFADYVRSRGGLPSLVSTTVSNKTDGHFEGKALLDYFEKLMLESHCSRVRASDQSADLNLRGLVSDSTAKTEDSVERSVRFQTTVTDSEAGEEVWQGEHRLVKSKPVPSAELRSPTGERNDGQP